MAAGQLERAGVRPATVLNSVQGSRVQWSIKDMAVYLDVPFVSQLNYGGGSNDYTGCWYCSACMVAYYFEQGPRMGVPELHSGSLTKEQRKALSKYLGSIGQSPNVQGHAATGSDRAWGCLQLHGVTGQNEHELLAEREGLQPVPRCADAFDFTVVNLERILRKYGPIFFYWRKTHGGHTYGHASVIIGTRDDGTVIYHDPENGPNSEMPIATFNTKRQKWTYAMMRRKPRTDMSDTDVGGLSDLFG